MTNEVAIKILQKLYEGCNKHKNTDLIKEAYNMAIEALKAESYASERYEDLCKFFRGCDDGGEGILHDRMEFKKWLERGRWHVEECDRLAKELDVLKAQIDKDINVPNTDCISRQAAIDALGEEPEVWSGKDEYEQGLNNQWHYDVNALKALPSVQPEIIRCNDCKKWHTNCLPLCGKHGCDVISDYTKPDDFCSWAERKTDD